jgi:hypothetical protein
MSGNRSAILETPSDIRLSEYLYLSNAAPALRGERAVRPRRRGKPSLAPIVALAALVMVGGFGFYLYVTAQRIGNLDRKICRSGNTSAYRAALHASARRHVRRRFSAR